MATKTVRFNQRLGLVTIEDYLSSITAGLNIKTGHTAQGKSSNKNALQAHHIPGPVNDQINEKNEKSTATMTPPPRGLLLLGRNCQGKCPRMLR